MKPILTIDCRRSTDRQLYGETLDHFSVKTTFILLALPTIVASALAGAFANLDFEKVRQPIPFLDSPYPDGRIVSAIRAFPGWVVLLNDMPQTDCNYNSMTLGSGGVDLISTYYKNKDITTTPITGNYSAYLQSGVAVGSLAQIGTIPIASKSLLFNSAGPGIEVRLSGSLTPVVNLGHTTIDQFTGYDTMGVDVSAWVGKEVELKFSSPAFFSVASLDDIRFSPTVLVPEPSTWVLLGVGAVLVWSQMRRQQ